MTNKEIENEISYNDEWKLNIFIPALLFYKTLYKIGLEGKKSGSLYSLNDSRFIDLAKKCLNEAIKEETATFDFISNYDMKDIKARTEGQLNQFFKRNLFDKKVLFFSLTLTDEYTINIVDKRGDVKKIIMDSC